MTPRILSDLHDVVRDRVAPYEPIALIERERESDLRLALAVHGKPLPAGGRENDLALPIPRGPRGTLRMLYRFEPLSGAKENRGLRRSEWNVARTQTAPGDGGSLAPRRGGSSTRVVGQPLRFAMLRQRDRVRAVAVGAGR